MTWTIEKFPNFVAIDSAEMIAELIALQLRAIQRSTTDEQAYADVYAAVFGAQDVANWIYRPPAEVARGITTLIREVGLFVLLDDAAAVTLLAEETAWTTRLPDVRIARMVTGTPIYTPSRRQQLNNRASMAMLVHRAACLAFAERLPSINIDNLPKTIQLRDVTTLMFGRCIAESTKANDGTLRMLRQIQTLAWRLIDARYGSPREEGVLILNAPMPSLVCAHYAYREAKQAQRVRDANPTAHPNFMPNELVIPTWP